MYKHIHCLFIYLTHAAITIISSVCHLSTEIKSDLSVLLVYHNNQLVTLHRTLPTNLCFIGPGNSCQGPQIQAELNTLNV